MNLRGRILDVAHRPHRYIEAVIALVFILGGLYLLSPWYVPRGEPYVTEYGDDLTTYVSRIIFGVLYMIPGVMMLVGLKWDKKWLREHALFGAWLVILFTVVLSWVVYGLFPINWLAPLGIGLISAVIWLRARWEGK